MNSEVIIWTPSLSQAGMIPSGILVSNCFMAIATLTLRGGTGVVVRKANTFHGAPQSRQRKQLQQPPQNQQLSRTSLLSFGILVKFFQLPGPLRYFISGNVGNVVFYIVQTILYKVIPSEWMAKASSTSSMMDSAIFFLAYMLHVPAQHWFHAVLVYGLDSINTPEKYWTTLAGTYSTLLTSAVLSTGLNTVLLGWGWNRTVAFFGTLYFFAFFNYMLIGWVVSKSSSKAAAAAATIASTTATTGGGGGGRAKHRILPKINQEPLSSTHVKL